MKRLQRAFPYIGMFAFVGLTWLLMMHRVRFGVDFTDETAYLTWAYRFSLGDRILLDTSEELQSIGSLLIAPMLKGFCFINGGYDGVVYCFRILYVLSTILLYWIAVYSLNRRKRNAHYVLFTLPVTIVTVANIYQFSYNTLSLNFAYASIWCMFSIREMGKKDMALTALSGCLAGLSAIIYPSFSILCVATGLLHYDALRKDNPQKAVCFIRIYMGSAGTAVFLFILWLLSSSEWDIRGIRDGIGAVFAQLQLKHPPSLIQKIRSAVLEIRKAANTHSMMYVVCFIVVSECIRKTGSLLRLNILLLLYIGVWLDFKISGASYFVVYANMFCSELYFFLRWAHMEDKGNIIKEILLPGFMIMILRFLTSDNQSVLMQIQTGFVLMAPFFPLCLTTQDEALNGRLCLIGMMIAALCLSVSYHSFYREEGYRNLNTEVKSGLYRHLYTTEQRYSVIDRLQQELEHYIQPKGGMTILTANHFVPVYMMSGMRPVTPDIWDAMGTNRNNTGAEPLLAFFERTGKQPDYILFEDYDGNTYWYDNPEYAFNSYIANHYDLIYESEETNYGYRTAIFKKRP